MAKDFRGKAPKKRRGSYETAFPPEEALQKRRTSDSDDCFHCEDGRMKLFSKKPKEGSGVIVALIGLLFSPVIIGIPILIGGIMMASEKVYWRECDRCGHRMSGRGSF